MDSSQEDLRHSLKEAWALTTSACTRIMTELYDRDVRRKCREKCPPMQRIYLYPEEHVLRSRAVLGALHQLGWKRPAA